MDSRRWEIRVLTLADGRVIRYDQGKPQGEREDREFMPKEQPGMEVVLDCAGIWRVFPRDQVVDRQLEDAPFVSADKLIGKAFFVFWPLRPEFRLKFIR